jgi:hypothetical protein
MKSTRLLHWLVAFAVALPIACEKEDDPVWIPVRGDGALGQLTRGGPSSEETVLVGSSVTLSLKRLEQSTVCTEGGGCSGPGCSTTTRTVPVSLLGATCQSAACRLVDARVDPLTSAVQVTIEGNQQGEAAVEVAVRDARDGQQYRDIFTVWFGVPEELAIEHTLTADVGAHHAALAGARYRWCATAQGLRNGKLVPLWLDEQALVLTVEGTGVAAEPPTTSPFVTSTPHFGVRRCLAFALGEPGEKTFIAQVPGLERRVPIRVVATDRVVGAALRSFELTDDPPLVDVELDPVLAAEDVTEIVLDPNPMISTIYALLLTLDDGSTALGGLGAMTVGPAGVVRVNKDVRITEDHEATPLMACAFFTLYPLDPGSGRIALDLGQAHLVIPVLVPGAVPISADGGAGGTGDAAGGESGSGEGGDAANAAGRGGESGSSEGGDFGADRAGAGGAAAGN